MTSPVLNFWFDFASTYSYPAAIRIAPLLLDSKSLIQGPGADSEEKRVLASDLDTVMVDSLKALDLIRPIREADIGVHPLWGILDPAGRDTFSPLPAT